jgi:predicted phosphodiesterase
MRLPLRILSDLHLGHKASRIEDVENLRPLFRGAGTVIFNGDTWEELSTHWRARSEVMLGQLLAILEEEGCDVVCLPGNHDPGWEGAGFIELAGGRIVVTHGDALLRDGAPWKREMLAGQNVVAALWKDHPAAETDPVARHQLAREIAKRLPNLGHPSGKSLFTRALDAVFPPRRAIAMLRAWMTQGRLGARFCERYFPRAELIIVGHFHCHGIRKSGGRTVINTGSFVVPGPAGWVEWDGKTLSAGRIREKSSGETLLGKAKLIRKFI